MSKYFNLCTSTKLKGKYHVDILYYHWNGFPNATSIFYCGWNQINTVLIRLREHMISRVQCLEAMSTLATGEEVIELTATATGVYPAMDTLVTPCQSEKKIK